MHKQGSCRYIRTDSPAKTVYQNDSCRYIRTTGRTKTGTFNALQIAEFVLLFLMAMDFKSRFFYAAFAAFGLLLVIKLDGLDLPHAAIPALMLSVSMALFSAYSESDLLGRIRPLVYPMCIIIGYNFTDSADIKKAGIHVVMIILILAAGAYCRYMLNMLINLGRSGSRNTIDFWTRSILSATLQSTMAVMMIGVTIAILFSTAKKAYKAMAVVALISILYYNLILSGRTIIILTALLCLVNIIVGWFSNKGVRVKLQGLMIILIIAAVIFFVMRSNLFGIRDIIYNSNLYKRFFTRYYADDINGDGRMSFKILYIKNMFSYPFGGDELRKAIGGHYAHDIILDTYSYAGIFAAAAVIIMLINTAVKCVKVCRIGTLDYDIRRLIISSLFSFFFIFFMEPILLGMPWLFASFCVVSGSISRITEL